MREVKNGIVDPQVLLESENQLKASIAARDAAKASILKAEAELLSRQSKLAQNKLDVEVARRRVAVAESDAKRLATLIGYLTVTAPYDGVVVARNANNGDYVAPGKGAPIYVIARTSTVRVFVDIPEKEAGSVRAGTKAEVLLPALREQLIRASVTRTSWALNAKSRSLRAEIDLPNAKGEILPGMYAYGKVFVERPGVWALPVSALHRSGARTFIWECDKGRAVRVEVQTGVSNGTWAQVDRRRLAGPGQDNRWGPINGSEQVIVGGSVFREGESVQIADPEP
jgi:RND family efflux transporter MFP subunit